MFRFTFAVTLLASSFTAEAGDFRNPAHPAFPCTFFLQKPAQCDESAFCIEGANRTPFFISPTVPGLCEFEGSDVVVLDGMGRSVEAWMDDEDRPVPAIKPNPGDLNTGTKFWVFMSETEQSFSAVTLVASPKEFTEGRLHGFTGRFLTGRDCNLQTIDATEQTASGQKQRLLIKGSSCN